MTQVVTNLPEDDEILKAVIQPFEVVKILAPAHLLSALIPIERYNKFVHMPYAPDSEMQETCEFVNGFNSLLNKMDSAQMQMRIKISIYCHIMESDYPFVVLWNLLRILNNLPCKWTFTRLTRKGNEETCEYTKDKIQELKRLGAALKLPTGGILARLWNGDLRNRFSHSQYTLLDNMFMGTQNTSPFSRKDGKTFLSSDVRYSSEYIDALHTKSCGFLKTFVDTYKHYSAPFKDGTPYQVQHGMVVWKPQFGWTWPETSKS